MTSYILDAIVAARWVLPPSNEPNAAQAIALLRQYVEGAVHLTIPSLFWPEIASLLWRSARTGRISPKTAQDSLARLEDLQIPEVPSRGLAASALSLSLAFDRSAYDAIYLALAVQTARPLITADLRLVNAVAAHLPIRWLGALA